MIRIATEADVPQMLAIYAPYIENTTITFEYNVPSESEFFQRFREITVQFPWLVWDEGGKVLGYAYGSAPFHRMPTGGAPKIRCICCRKRRAGASARRSVLPLKKFLLFRVTSGFMP